MQVCALLCMCMYARVSCEFVVYHVSACVLVLKLHEFVLYSVMCVGRVLIIMAFVHGILGSCDGDF